MIDSAGLNDMVGEVMMFMLIIFYVKKKWGEKERRRRTDAKSLFKTRWERLRRSGARSDGTRSRSDEKNFHITSSQGVIS